MPREPSKQCARVIEVVARERRLLGQYALDYGPSRAAEIFGTTLSRAKYWRQKMVDPSFHPHKVGRSHRTFRTYELPEIHQRLIGFLREQPNSKFHDICSFMSALRGRTVSRAVVSRLLKKMGWSWKVPVKFQVQVLS